MSKDETYRQCLVRRGAVQQTTWIPSEFAVTGGVVKLQDEGVWTDGWLVVEAYGPEVDRETALAQSRFWKIQREASDI